MCHDDVTSVEEIAHGRHVESPASEFRHRKSVRGLCVWVDVAGGLTKALVGRDLLEPGVLPLQEKPCKLNDFVVASEASGFSVDDQYLHRLTCSRISCMSCISCSRSCGSAKVKAKPIGSVWRDVGTDLADRRSRHDDELGRYPSKGVAMRSRRRQWVVLSQAVCERMVCSRRRAGMGFSSSQMMLIGWLPVCETY